MVDFIVEKTPTATQPPTQTKVKFASSTAIEGYEPKRDMSDTINVNPAAEVAAMLNIPSAKPPVQEEEDSDATEPDDDEDQQWKDMFDQMRKRD
jgi:type IV secretory pathway VirB10-like protein